MSEATIEQFLSKGRGSNRESSDIRKGVETILTGFRARVERLKEGMASMRKSNVDITSEKQAMQ